MSKNPFPHRVTVVISKSDFSVVLAWLRDHGHEIRVTMMFGGSHHVTGNDHIKQVVCFRDQDAAMLFKLAWTGR